MSRQQVIYPFYDKTATIALNGTVSPEVDIEDFDLVGVITPSTFDGTGLTISAATVSGGTFYPVAASNAASTAYAITTAASIWTPIDPIVTRGLRFIKLTAGSTQTTTSTVITLVLRKKK